MATKRDAFDEIAESARNDLFCDILALIADKVERQGVVSQIKQLSLEVNRRDIVKRHFIFKMVQWLDFKKRFAMIQMRLRTRGVAFALRPENFGEAVRVLGNFP